MKPWILIMLSMVCLGGCKENLNAEVLLNLMESADPSELKQIVINGKAQSERIDSISLILLSTIALKDKDFLNAELFMIKALARAGVDREVYPPVNSGGDSPLLPLMAMRQNLAFAIQQGPQKSADEYQLLVDSFDQWQPICNSSYNPGWEYSGKPDFEYCKKQFSEVISNNVIKMNERAVYYHNPEYHSLFKEWQKLLMAGVYSNPDEPNEKLMELQIKLVNIESELGVKGDVTKYVETAKLYDNESAR